MRKRFFVSAIIAAAGCAAVLSGCVGCNGCNGGDGKRNAAAFSSNWYADTNFKYIQPTFWEENKEVINYKVKFDAETASNRTYKVEYAEGDYKTTFYAIKNFDASVICEEFKSGYPETAPSVYYYKTELSISSVKFTLGGETKTFDESNGGDTRVVTECYFLDVQNYLRPLYSVQDIKTVSPAEYQVDNLERAYKQFNELHTTSYSFDGNNAKTVIINRLDGDNKTEKTVTGLNEGDNSLIDVAGLNVAVRAMQLGGGFNQLLSLYSPSGNKQDYIFTGSSASLPEEERMTVETELLKHGLFKEEKDGDDKVKPLETTAVTAALNAGLKGVSQTYWFTAVKNDKNNTGRATMVKMSVPLNFSLGTFNYVLESVESTLWNGK